MFDFIQMSILFTKRGVASLKITEFHIIQPYPFHKKRHFIRGRKKGRWSQCIPESQWGLEDPVLLSPRLDPESQYKEQPMKNETAIRVHTYTALSIKKRTNT